MRIAALLFALALPASAATLAPDSLLCESPDSIAFSRQAPSLKGQPASVVMTRAKAQVDFVELRQKSPMAGRFPREDAAMEAALPPFQQIVSGCMVAGPMQVVVLEVKPISGVARVSAKVKGTSVEVFTAADSVAP